MRVLEQHTTRGATPCVESPLRLQPEGASSFSPPAPASPSPASTAETTVRRVQPPSRLLERHQYDNLGCIYGTPSSKRNIVTTCDSGQVVRQTQRGCHLQGAPQVPPKPRLRTLSGARGLAPPAVRGRPRVPREPLGHRQRVSRHAPRIHATRSFACISYRPGVG
jgi:hypothetical protein